jgi:hypothetical protein
MNTTTFGDGWNAAIKEIQHFVRNHREKVQEGTTIEPIEESLPIFLDTLVKPAEVISPCRIIDNRPPKEQIERLAYALYLARGCQHGQDWADWFAAEQDLMYMPESSAEQIATVTRPPKQKNRKSAAGAS